MDVQSIINAIHSPETNPQRNGFDLSHRKVLTYKVGELLPVLCKELVPKDYLEVDIATLVRSVSPLNTAAFLRSKIYFDFFFVPMTAVWRNFDKFYYQRDDNYTSLSLGAAYEPNITIAEINALCGKGSSSIARDSTESRCKLFNLLGYGNWINEDTVDYDTGGVFENIGKKSLTALPLFAYNRIYNLHYRDPWKDQPNIYDVQAMSADSVYCDTYANSLIYPSTSYQTSVMGAMRYHKYPMDLFMGLLPSQQFGSVSSVNISSVISELHNSVGEDGDVATIRDDSSGHHLLRLYRGGSLVSGSQNWKLASDSSFDIIALRRAIAAQKWKEYNMRAGWKGSKQAKAMFGVTTPDDRKHDVEFIDSYSFPIMVDEVVQTSESTATSPMGELAGKVIGVGNGHKIKFSSGERHGYFFCISYILPQVEYNAFGIDKQLVRSTPESHYMPAYQNLGLEPVFRYEVTAPGFNSGTGDTTFDSTLGFTTRYHEYKTEYDKVYAEFQTGSTLQSWVSVRRDLQSAVNSGFIPVSLLYVDPIIMDTVFVAQAGPSLATDQFMANINFDLKMVRPMSALGLPTL